MPMADLKKVTSPPPPPQRNKMSNFQISRPKHEKKCPLTPPPPPPLFSGWLSRCDFLGDQKKSGPPLRNPGSAPAPTRSIFNILWRI